MIRRDRLFSLIHSASAMSLLFAASVCAPSRSVLGQTVALPYVVAAPGAIGKSAAPVNFLAAPAFAVSDIPSSAISADLNGDGKPDLIVASALTGEITVYLGAGQGKFSNPAVYSVGGHPVAIASADLRGSGRQDILAANGTDKTVSVLFGLGDGKLGPAQVYSTGIEADLLAVGSLKGSGQPDIAAASSAGKALAVLLNDGHGGLLAATAQALPRTPVSITLARFGASGHPDLALANTDGTVSILPGRGDGSFNSASLLNVSSSALSLIVAGDFDRDGKTDLAVAEPDGRLLTVLRGNGDGTFTRGASYAVGNDPVHALSLDVNGDGIPDLVTANRGSNTFSTLLGNGDGSFKPAVHSTVGDGPVALASGDFYGRGFTGLAVLNAASKTVSVVDGNGDGSFKAALSYSSDLSPRSIVSGDLNGDGRPDLVVANFCGADAACAKSGTLSVYLAKASGGYTLASKLPVGAGPVSVALADLNGDKNLDAIVLNRTGKSVSILLGAGDGTFAESRTLSLAEAPAAFVLGDFNKDGKTDLAIVSDCGSAKCSQPGSLTILFGAGDGSFSPGRAYPVGYSPASVGIADIDLDGNPDILVANRCGTDQTCASHGTASVFTGDGKGSFTAKPDIALGKNPSSLALDSLTGGKAPDLIVTQETDNTVAVFRGNGDGTFAAPASYAVGSAPRSAVIADFTGTGTKSVAVANFRDSTVSLLANKGDGTLLPSVSYSVGAGPESLAAVTGKSGTAASIVTANGSSTSATPGLSITDLTHAAPDTGGYATMITSLTITPGSPEPYGVALTFAATVKSPTSSGPSIPNGTITISDESNPSICVIQLTDGTTTSAPATNSGSCSPTSPLDFGSHTITATYAPPPPPAVVVYQGSSGPATLPVLQINAVEVGVSMVAGPTSLVYGQSGTYSVGLTAQDGSTATPVGTVTFFNALGTGTVSCQESTMGQTAGQVTVSHGTATCTYIASSTGAFQINASYSPGNSNFTNTPGPGNGPLLLTVAPVQTSVAVSGSLTVNQTNAVVTATVTANSPGTINPNTDGTVTFTLRNGTATTVTNAIALSGGTAQYTITPAVLPGAYSITAAYSGTANFASSTGTALLTPGVSQTSVALTAPSTANYGDSVTFTATVTSTGTTQPSTGAVTFTSAPGIPNPSSTPLQCTTLTVVTTPSYKVSCAVSSLALSPSGSVYTIKATYAGDGNGFSGSSTTSLLTVNKATPVLSITPSATNTLVNQPVTFTAAFTGLTAPPPSGGTFTFTNTPLNGQSTILCAGSIYPTCTASMTSAVVLHAGSNSVSVVYMGGGDPNYTSSSSSIPPAVVTVTQGPTSVTLSPSTTTSTVDQQVTFTATVAQTQSGTTSAIPLTGSVAFTVTPAGGSSTTLCPTVTLAPPSAVATCVTSAMPLGTADTVTATYTYAGATSTATDFGNSSGSSSQTVTAAAAKIQYVQSFDNGSTQPVFTSTVNDAVSFTAKVVADVPPSTSAPTPPAGGLVAFTATYTPASGTSSPVAVNFICAESLTLAHPSNGAVPLSNGIATCTPAAPKNLLAGTYQVSAQYLPTPPYYPDPNFKASPASSPVLQTVQPAAIGLTINTLPPLPSGTTSSTSIATQAVTYTAALTATPSGAVLPSGTVTFTTTGNATEVCPVAASLATCPITYLSGTSSVSSPFTVTATYNGDNNFKVGVATGPPAIVEDFSLTPPVTNFTGSQTVTDPTAPAPVLFVSQGYTIGTGSANTDPFFTIAPVVTEGILSGFGDTVTLICKNAGGPTCSVQPTVTPANPMIPLTISAGTSANPTAAGDYAFTLQGTDAALLNVSPPTSLIRTAAFTVTVVPVTPNQSVSVLAEETASAQFVVSSTATGVPSPSAPYDTFTFACSKAINTNTGTTTTYPLASTDTTSLYCKPAVGSGPLTPAADGTYSTTFFIGNQSLFATQSQYRPAQSKTVLLSATLFGVPFFALIGWLGRGRYRARPAIRLLGMAVLAILLSQAIGCGNNGGFVTPVNTAQASAFTQGNYLVRVTATDQKTKIIYYSTIQFSAGQ